MEYPFASVEDVIEYAKELRDHHRKDNGERCSKVCLVGCSADVVVDFTGEDNDPEPPAERETRDDEWPNVPYERQVP